ARDVTVAPAPAVRTGPRSATAPGFPRRPSPSRARRSSPPATNSGPRPAPTPAQSRGTARGPPDPPPTPPPTRPSTGQPDASTRPRGGSPPPPRGPGPRRSSPTNNPARPQPGACPYAPAPEVPDHHVTSDRESTVAPAVAPVGEDDARAWRNLDF